jgi:hypothetical protein
MMKDQMKKTSTPASRGSNPKPPNNAELVFARVLQLLQQQNGSSNVSVQEWLKKNHTIADVQEEVTKAQAQYNLRSQSKVRRWLARFSTGVLLYGQILDVLVQHHPEYVSLVWGTTKLLFVVSSKNTSEQQIFSWDTCAGTVAGDVGSSLLHLTCPLRETNKIARNSRLSQGMNTPCQGWATIAAACLT